MRIINGLIIFMVSISGLLFAETIHVPGDYAKIQYALDAAAKGDLILVAPGIYEEGLHFPLKKITLKSIAGPEWTILDAGKGGPVIRFVGGHDQDSVVDGFTLKNGIGEEIFQYVHHIDWLGGGIYCLNSSPTLINNIIRDNSVTTYYYGDAAGGGIYIEDGSPYLFNNIFTDNYSMYNGAAIFVKGSSAPVFDNVLIYGNDSPEGTDVTCPIGCFINCTMYWTYVSLSSNTTVRNSILWPYPAGLANYSYSNVKGGHPGVGNIDTDPLFLDVLSHNYRLRQDPCQPGITNPCVDSGDPFSPLFKGSTRTDGLQDSGIVDMGYHYYPFIHVPLEYASIQDAISNAVDRDTVRVAPGTYLENIDFLGKSIRVESVAGPCQTILDGGQNGSVVTFQNEEIVTAGICGFTITNGSGHGEPGFTGGGVTCINASPTVENNIFTANNALYAGGGACCRDGSSTVFMNNEFHGNEAGKYGAGVFCYQSKTVIKSNTISDNRCLDPGGMGGGIGCWEAPADIRDNTIHSNEVKSYGGGICCWYSDALIVNCMVYGNSSGDSGGGIWSYLSRPVLINDTLAFNESETAGGGFAADDEVIYISNSIFWENKAPVHPELKGGYLDVKYCDVKGGWPGMGNIDSDPGFSDPLTGDFHLATDQSPCFDAGSNDVALLPEADFEGDPRITYGTVDMGADELFGTRVFHVPGDFSSIQAAVDFAVNGDVVEVGPGSYMENISIVGKSVSLKSDAGPWDTIIDGGGIDPVVRFENIAGSDVILKGFTITNGKGRGVSCLYTSIEIQENIITNNSKGGVRCYGLSSPVIHNNIIGDNTEAINGGGIDCESCTPVISMNIIHRNSAEKGGGISLVKCDAIIANNVIHENTAVHLGGGIRCKDSTSSIIHNNTLYNNKVTTVFLGKGGCIGCVQQSSMIFQNNICWNNKAGNGKEVFLADGAEAYIGHTDIEGGLASVVVNGSAVLNWGPGNIDSDPLFVETACNDFHLSHGSPCRDVGENNGISELYDFEGDPRIASSIVDMGADEFYNHLYVVGDETPGGSIISRIVGSPGASPVGLFIGSDVLADPLNTMWGYFYLEAPWMLFPLYPVPGNGILEMAATLPALPPAPYDVPMQAFIGLSSNSLTNLCVIHVR